MEHCLGFRKVQVVSGFSLALLWAIGRLRRLR